MMHVTKSGDQQTTLYMEKWWKALHTSEFCKTELTKLLEANCEKDIGKKTCDVTTFRDQQTTMLMNKEVKSIKRFKASSNRNHEVARSELWERCQRKNMRREDNIVTITGDQPTTL